MTESADMSTKDVCSVCHDDIEIYAVGKCDHYVCYKCSTRMRVLCEQMYCAICRAELPEVFFLSRYRKFEECVGKFKLHHQKENIYFENVKAQKDFLDLLSHKCNKCARLSPVKTFRELEVHMRKEHNLHYCDICVNDLKIFTAERKCYTREDLARHRRLGDIDDQSFKGHPLCELCDQRYLDRDELARHCRKEHYYCHFCETDGLSLIFYGDYSILKDHFKEKHYLCEEGDCYNTQFTNAFRSEIDLKAHRANEHSRCMNKAEIRQARTIEVDFQLAPRQVRGRGGRHRGRNRDYNSERGLYVEHGKAESADEVRERQKNHAKHQREEYEAAQAVALHLNELHRQSGAVITVDRSLLNPVAMDQVQDELVLQNGQKFAQVTEDFPTLAGRKGEPTPDCGEETQRTQAVKRDTLAKKLSRAGNMSVRDGSMEDEDFPSLAGVSCNKLSQQTSSRKSAWQTQLADSDFPVLSSHNSSKSHAKNGSGKGGNHASANSWVKPDARDKLTSRILVQPSARANNLPVEDDFPSLHSIGNMLLNSVPVAPGLSLTRSSSASLSGLGHGQPMMNGAPTKSVSAANFCSDDFPALGGQRGVSNLAGSKWAAKHKGEVGLQASANSSRQHGKQIAPMPDFTGSSESEIESREGQATSKEKKSNDKPDEWQVVKGKETGNISGKEKSMKKNSDRKPSGRANVNTKEEDTRKNTAKKNSEKRQDKKDANMNRKQQKLRNGKNRREEPSRDSVINDGTEKDHREMGSPKQHQHEVSDMVDVCEKENNGKKLNDLDSSCDKTDVHGEVVKSCGQWYSKRGVESSKVENFPSFFELSGTTNIVPLLSLSDEHSCQSYGKESPSAPPGFGGIKAKVGLGPPPGFDKPASSSRTPKPPPGFRGPLVNDVENVEALSFMEPANFKQRNERLINDIKEMIIADEFDKFKKCSIEFRQGIISAKEYYKRCSSIMARDQLEKIFSELIALLPDIGKQQELLAVHSSKDIAPDDIIHIKQAKRLPWKTDALLSSCNICKQVLINTDLGQHISKHNMYLDFPALGSSQ